MAVLNPRASTYVRERLRGVSLLPQGIDPACEVAIIIPIFREPVHRVVNLLLSIARQNNLKSNKLEVLCVVNNGPDDGSADWQMVRRSNQLIMDLPIWRNGDYFGAHMRFPAEVLQACEEIRDRISVFLIDASTPGQTLSSGNVGEARNRGLAEAVVRFDRIGKNGLAIFLDADVVLDDQGYFSKVETLLGNRNVVAACGDVRMIFDPDMRETEERTRLEKLFQRFLMKRRWMVLERFWHGKEIGILPVDAFLGMHILSRTADAADWGGFRDWDKNEDSVFGDDARMYASEHGKTVLNLKEKLSVASALRDSDRTGASFKPMIEVLNNVEMDLVVDPFTTQDNVVLDRAIYERLEQAVSASEAGRELVDYLAEPAHVLWDHFEQS